MSNTRSQDDLVPYNASPVTLRLADVLRGHRWENYALCFSPDSQFLAAGSDEAPLSLWMVERRQRIATIDVRASTPWLIAFSPVESLVAVPGNGEDVQVCTYQGDVQTTLPGHSPKVAGIVFLPPGDLLLTIDGIGIARVWEWAAQREVSAFSVLDASDSATLVESQDVHPTIQAQARKGNVVYGMAVSPSGEQLIINGYSSRGLLQLWSIDAVARMAHFDAARLDPKRRDYVLRQRFSPDGRFLAALVTTYYQIGEKPPLEERIELYQVDSFALKETIQPPLDGRWCVLKDMAFSPDGRYLALVGAGGYHHEMEGTLWIWDLVAHQFIMSVLVHPDVGDNQVWPVSAIDWNGQGTLIATAGWEPSEQGGKSAMEHLADQLVVKLWHVMERN